MVLEQLLLNNELPMRVLDLNADFVRLCETLEPVPTDVAAEWAGLDIRVRRSGDAHDGEPLRCRYVDLSPAAKAALLQIDPILNAAEYNVLLRSEQEALKLDAHDMVQQLRDSGDPVREHPRTAWKTCRCSTGACGRVARRR